MYTQSIRSLKSPFRRISIFARSNPIVPVRMASTNKSHATGGSKVPGKIQEKVPKGVEESLPDSVSQHVFICLWGFFDDIMY